MHVGKRKRLRKISEADSRNSGVPGKLKKKSSSSASRVRKRKEKKKRKEEKKRKRALSKTLALYEADPMLPSERLDSVLMAGHELTLSMDDSRSCSAITLSSEQDAFPNDGHTSSEELSEVGPVRAPGRKSVTPSNISDVMRDCDIGLDRVFTMCVPHRCLPTYDKSFGDMPYNTEQQQAIKSLFFFFSDVFHTLAQRLSLGEKKKRSTDLSSYFFVSEATTPAVVLPRVVMFQEYEDFTDGKFAGYRFFFVILDSLITAKMVNDQFMQTMERYHDELVNLKNNRLKESSRHDSWTDSRCRKHIPNVNSYYDVLKNLPDAYIDRVINTEESNTKFSNSNLASPDCIFTMASLSTRQFDSQFFESIFEEQTVAGMCHKPRHTINKYVTDDEVLCFPATDCVQTVLRNHLSPEKLSSTKCPFSNKRRNALSSSSSSRFALELSLDKHSRESHEEMSRSAERAFRKAKSIVGEEVEDVQVYDELDFAPSSQAPSISLEELEAKKNRCRFDVIGMENVKSVSEQLREIDTIEQLKKMNIECFDYINAARNPEILDLEEKIEEIREMVEGTGSELLLGQLSKTQQAEIVSQLKKMEEHLDELFEERQEVVASERDKMAKTLFNILGAPEREGVAISDPMKGVLREFAQMTNNNTDGSNFWWHFNHGEFHGNLSYFGSVIVRLWNMFQACCRINPSGDNVRKLFNILGAALSPWFYEINPEELNPTEEKQIYQYTMRGEYESSKSFLMRCISAGLIAATVLEISYATEKSFTIGNGIRDAVMMNHEANPIMFTSGNRDGSGGGESFILKDMAKGWTFSQRIGKNEDGNLELKRSLTMVSIAMINATNVMNIAKDSGAQNTRHQMERKIKSERTIPSEKVEMTKLVNELIGKELADMMRPFARIMKSLQIVLALTSQETRSRVLPRINCDAYKVLSTAVQEELENLGFDEEALVRDIRRGETLAEVYGYLYAIICEYFSPYGVEKHQRNPETGKLDMPFDFSQMHKHLAPRLYVTIDIAAFVLSCMQYQFVRIDKLNMIRQLRDYCIRTFFPKTWNISRVVATPRKMPKKTKEDSHCKKTSYLPKPGVYDPVNDLDMLFLYAFGKTIPTFREVARTFHSHSSTTTITYDPNYFCITVTSPDREPLYTFAQMIQREMSDTMHAMDVISEQLTDLANNPRKNVYKCSYEYPKRTETYEASGETNINTTVRQSLGEVSGEWKARYLTVPKSMTILFVEADPNHSNTFHIYLLRQALCALIGSTTVENAMKCAIERVVRRIPGVNHDIVLAQLHRGPGVDAMGERVVYDHKGLFEVARTHRRIYKNQDWWKKQQANDPKADKAIAIKNQLPIERDQFNLLSDGICETWDMLVRERFTSYTSAKYHIVTENEDDTAAEMACEASDIKFDPAYTQERVKQTNIAIQSKWVAKRITTKGKVNGRAIYPDHEREDRVARKLGHIRYGASMFGVNRSRRRKKCVRKRPRIREQNSSTMPLPCDDPTDLRSKRLQALMSGSSTVEDILSLFPPTPDEKNKSIFHDILYAINQNTRPSSTGLGVSETRYAALFGEKTVKDVIRVFLDKKKDKNAFSDSILNTELVRLFGSNRSFETQVREWIKHRGPGPCIEIERIVENTIRKLSLDRAMFERAVERWVDTKEESEILELLQNLSSGDRPTLAQIFHEPLKKAVERREGAKLLDSGELLGRDDPNALRRVLWFDPTSGIMVENAVPADRDATPTPLDVPIEDSLTVFGADFPRNYVFVLPDTGFVRPLRMHVESMRVGSTSTTDLSDLSNIIMADLESLDQFLTNIRKSFEAKAGNRVHMLRRASPITVCVNASDGRFHVDLMPERKVRMAKQFKESLDQYTRFTASIKAYQEELLRASAMSPPPPPKTPQEGPSEVRPHPSPEKQPENDEDAIGQFSWHVNMFGQDSNSQ